MPTASARALSLADDLERWIQLAERSSRSQQIETRGAEVNTDITMQEMEEWDQVEAEMSPEDREFTDEKAEALQARLRFVAEEEQRLSEELANLKAQLKQEKAFNHQQSQAHQQQVRKLKVALNKRKKEHEAKEQQQRKAQEKAQQDKEETEREEAKLQQQLQQARELNQKLKDKLQENSGGDSHKSKLKNLRQQIHTLKCSLLEEHEKEQHLKHELDQVAEEETQILAETKQCKAKVRLLTSQASMLKQMVNVSSAELEGWNEQVERLQIRKQEARDTAKERQVMEKCAKKYQRRQLGLPDEKDSEGKTIPSNPSVSRTSSRSTGLSLKETSVTIFGKGTVKKKNVVELENTKNSRAS